MTTKTRIHCNYNEASQEVIIDTNGCLRGVHVTNTENTREELDIYSKTEIDYNTKRVVHVIISFYRNKSTASWAKFISNEHKYDDGKLEVNESQYCDSVGNFVTEDVAVTDGVYNEGYTNYYKLWESQMRAVIDNAVCEGIERHN